MRLVDQINHPVELRGSAKRIVSLVPSQTEYLSYLGLNEETVGLTKFCIHPDVWFRQKARIGGTKNVDIEKVLALKPDLIIANKEENTKEDIEALQGVCAVYTSDISNVEDAYDMMVDIGLLTGKHDEALQLCQDLKSDFKELPRFSGSVLYLIWRSPYMSAGTGTFITEMLGLLGLKNSHTSNLRYDEISEEGISELSPDYIFLSSEPYPFKQKHIEELQTLTDAKVILVDGEMFSWYGSRLLKFTTYVKKTLSKQLV